MRTPDELTGLFRASGRKVTAQRQCIFRALQKNVSHPSAEMVYDKVRGEMETISLKTVYQTLNDLVELGEVAALDLGTGTVRFDPNVEAAHHHLVCRSCGKVRDLFMAFRGLEVPLGEAQGYDVSSAEVVFRGLCGQCRRRGGVRAGAVGPDAHRSAGDRSAGVRPTTDRSGLPETTGPGIGTGSDTKSNTATATARATARATAEHDNHQRRKACPH